MTWRPVIACLVAVFAAYMVGVAVFLSQIPAVLASRPLARLARGHPGGIAVAHATTILWMSLTSVFFFHGIDLIFPFFYAAEPPLP